MSSPEVELLYAFEVHSVEKIRELLDAGVDARAPIKGKPPIDWLTEMYFRSNAFPDCLRLLLDRGAVLKDPVVLPVLLNDGPGVQAALRAAPKLVLHRTDMVSCFTPLLGATLLHVAAEYGNADAAQALIENGALVNAPAALDDHGCNGHTPLFHTVNSWDNRSARVMKLLLDAGARTDILLPGLVWGKGFEWETTFFDVTPISYAQFGLLPQVTRREADIYANIRTLLAAAGRRAPPLPNVPNAYLKPKIRD